MAIIHSMSRILLAAGALSVGGQAATAAQLSAHASVERRPLVCEVKPYGGRPTLWIDGKPDLGLMHFNRWLKTDDVAVFKAADVHLYSIMGAPEMPSPDGGKVDYGDGLAALAILTEKWIDETFSMIEKADSEAKVLVRLRLTTPDWWRRLHPGECVVVSDPRGGLHPRPWASPASDLWRKLCDETVRRTVGYLERKWGHMVLGYHPGMVACCENAYDWGIGVADLSPVNVRDFKGKVPDPRSYFTRGFGDVRRLLDPEKESDAIAFMRYQSERMADAAVFLAQSVKGELRRLGRTKICGAFYAYMSMPVNLTDYFCSGHQAHERVLASPDVDFIAAPIDYASRQIGGTSLAQALPGSVTAHGKLYWAEEDTRLHRAKSEGACVAETTAETRNVLLRSFFDAYSHGGAIWWMDLFGRGWYRERSFVPVLAECREFSRKHFGRRQSVAEVAVFVTERAVASERAAPLPLSNELVGAELPEIAACGAPHDVFRLEDLPVLSESGVLGRYRLAVVLNAHSADDKLRKTVKDLLCRDDRTVVFLGPAGYVCGRKSGAALCEELTGIRVKVRDVRDSGMVETFCDGRRSSFGAALASSPSLLINDKAARQDGWYVQGTSRSRAGEPRAVAIACKQMQGWKSVVCPIAFMPSELIRRYAEEAGVHVYSPCGDQVFAGEGWFAVAAKMPGRRKLRAPWNAAPIEVDMARGEFRVFER